MRPFDLPANVNSPLAHSPLAGLAWSYSLPYTFWSLGMEMALQNWRILAAVQEATVEAMGRAAGGTPAAAFAAADLRETSEAMLRAQLDAIDTVRRAV